MSSLELDETAAAGRIGTETQPRHAISTKVALEELLGLLEKYGPTWYTEEHHHRALNALQAQ